MLGYQQDNHRRRLLRRHAHRVFQEHTDFEIQPPARMPLTIPQIIENIWQNGDRDYHVRALAKHLRRIEKDMSGEARTEYSTALREARSLTIFTSSASANRALLGVDVQELAEKKSKIEVTYV